MILIPTHAQSIKWLNQIYILTKVKNCRLEFRMIVSKCKGLSSTRNPLLRIMVAPQCGDHALPLALENPTHFWLLLVNPSDVTSQLPNYIKCACAMLSMS